MKSKPQTEPSFSISGFAHISLVNSLAGTQKKAGPADSRKGRMFNVLEVVRFPNDACTTGNENTSGIVAQGFFLSLSSASSLIKIHRTQESAIRLLSVQRLEGLWVLPVPVVLVSAAHFQVQITTGRLDVKGIGTR